MRTGRPLARPDRAPIAKSLDSWWTVLAVDPLAVPLARRLARHPGITPTMVTIASAPVGVLGIVLLLVGPLPAAAVVLHLRFLLDCVDGKVARAQGRSSRFGATLDVVVDTVIVHAAHAALAVRVGTTPRTVALGVATLASAMLAAWLRTVRQQALAAPAPAQRPLIPGTRLRRQPSTVEAEAWTLVLAPLTGRVSVVVAAMALALVYYLTNATRSAAIVLRATRRADQAAGVATDGRAAVPVGDT